MGFCFVLCGTVYIISKHTPLKQNFGLILEGGDEWEHKMFLAGEWDVWRVSFRIYTEISSNWETIHVFMWYVCVVFLVGKF